MKGRIGLRHATRPFQRRRRGHVIGHMVGFRARGYPRTPATSLVPKGIAHAHLYSTRPLRNHNPRPACPRNSLIPTEIHSLLVPCVSSIPMCAGDRFDTMGGREARSRASDATEGAYGWCCAQAWRGNHCGLAGIHKKNLNEPTNPYSKAAQWSTGILSAGSEAAIDSRDQQRARERSLGGSLSEPLFRCHGCPRRPRRKAPYPPPFGQSERRTGRCAT